MNPFAHSSILIKKSILEEIGKYDNFFEKSIDFNKNRGDAREEGGRGTREMAAGQPTAPPSLREGGSLATNGSEGLLEEINRFQ